VKLENSKHSHPCVLKVTLLMSPGRRQWLGLEGKLVLEEEKHAARTWERREASTANKPTSDAGPQRGEEDSTARESISNPGSQHGEEDSTASKSTLDPDSQHGGEDSTASKLTPNPEPQHGEEDSTAMESTSEPGNQHEEEDSTAGESMSNPGPQHEEEDSTARKSTSDPGPQHGEEDSTAKESTSDPGNPRDEEDSTARKSTSESGPEHGEEDSTRDEISIDSESEPIRKQRACGRCSDAISFHSTYYKCLGHLCRGALNSEMCPTFHLEFVLAITDYYLCGKCEPDLTDVERHQHKWWHSLLIIPKSYLAAEDAPKASETQSTAEVPAVLSEGKTGEEAPPSISSLNEKISRLNEKLDSTRQALEGRLTTTMETLEKRVTRLDTSVEELKQLLMQVLSNRTNL
jgi:hypothetical protein